MRHSLATAVLGALHVDCLLIKIVLQGKVLGPGSRIIDRVIEFHYAIERILGFLFAFENIDQQCRNRKCCYCGQCKHRDEQAPRPSWFRISCWSVHEDSEKG